MYVKRFKKMKKANIHQCTDPKNNEAITNN